MNDRTDPRSELRRAFEQASTVVKGVSTSQLGGPTPCSEFDVSALLSHLLGVANRVAGIGHGEKQTHELHTKTGLETEQWSAEFDQAMSEALRAWGDDSLLERELVLPFGTFPGSLVAQIYTLELVMHSWDLAAATGQTSVLKPDLAETAFPIAKAVLPPEPRGGEMPFAAVVTVPEGATTYDKLAGYLGRQPV